MSAAANIAEGSAKRGAGEFRRFLDIAMGSLAEVSYLLHLARKLEYITEEQWGELDTMRSGAGKLTWRLYQAISKRVKPTA